MTIGRIAAAASLALAVMLSPGVTLLADAIDGEWCFADGRWMPINGPRIHTPGGNRIEGDYDRHAFAYAVPDVEPGAGSAVSMDLIDDDTLHLRIGRTMGAPQTWRRCAEAVS